jgi:hypothetical protein
LFPVAVVRRRRLQEFQELEFQDFEQQLTGEQSK